MKENLPYIAIAISIISLSLSIYSAWRDKPHLKTAARAYRHPETGEFSAVFVKAVNVGRRPIILRYLWGKYEGGYTAGHSLADGTIKLNEGDFFEERIGKFDGMMIHMGDHGELSATLKDLCLEDTAGKKFRIKNAKKSIQQISNGRHPFGIRTHSQ